MIIKCDHSNQSRRVTLATRCMWCMFAKATISRRIYTNIIGQWRSRKFLIIEYRCIISKYFKKHVKNLKKTKIHHQTSLPVSGKYSALVFKLNPRSKYFYSCTIHDPARLAILKFTLFQPSPKFSVTECCDLRCVHALFHGLKVSFTDD